MKKSKSSKQFAMNDAGETNIDLETDSSHKFEENEIGGANYRQFEENSVHNAIMSDSTNKLQQNWSAKRKFLTSIADTNFTNDRVSRPAFNQDVVKSGNAQQTAQTSFNLRDRSKTHNLLPFRQSAYNDPTGGAYTYKGIQPIQDLSGISGPIICLKFFGECLLVVFQGFKMAQFNYKNAYVEINKRMASSNLLLKIDGKDGLARFCEYFDGLRLTHFFDNVVELTVAGMFNQSAADHVAKRVEYLGGNLKLFILDNLQLDHTTDKQKITCFCLENVISKIPTRCEQVILDMRQTHYRGQQTMIRWLNNRRNRVESVPLKRLVIKVDVGSSLPSFEADLQTLKSLVASDGTVEILVENPNGEFLNYFRDNRVSEWEDTKSQTDFVAGSQDTCAWYRTYTNVEDPRISYKLRFIRQLVNERIEKPEEPTIFDNYPNCWNI